jgi:putative PIN family toxin of toxin-antitoxin system
MRVVLDANVYVSSLLTQSGNAKQIIDMLEDSSFELIISEPILDEIRRVLSYPHLVKTHKKSTQDIDNYVELLRQNSILVDPQERLNISIDESDNRYIECAVEGEVDVLVTGDKKHLLPIKEYQGIQILSPTAFLILIQMGET